ncbi:MAG: type II toxin-antitoxin system HicA family toxin [Planctomycetia bacterium]
MPPKIRDLVRGLEAAGFINLKGRGSHRNFLHFSGARVTISGNFGDDAKPYQQRIVRAAIAESIGKAVEEIEEDDP